jgi:hypothetical protein
MAKAKKTTTTNKQPVKLSSGQEKAANALIASLEKLSPKYLDITTLENTVQAELVIFYSKFKVEPRSKAARKLNSTERSLLVQYCPNMPINTVKLMIKCAQASTSVDKLKIKAGTLSAKTVLNTFNKAKDNTNKQNRKLSLTGYLRRELPKTKAKATGNKVKLVAKATISIAAKDATTEALEAILEVLDKNDCKLVDGSQSELSEIIGQAIDTRIAA